MKTAPKTVTLQTVTAGSYKSSDGRFQVILAEKQTAKKPAVWQIIQNGESVETVSTWMEALAWVRSQPPVESQPEPAPVEMPTEIETETAPAPKKSRKARRQKATA